MILIEGTVTIDPSKLEDHREAMQTMLEKSRAEEGCIEYAFSIDVLDPSILRVNERWTDMAALAAHGKSAHMADWREATKAMGASGRDIRMYIDPPEPKPL